MIFPRNQTAILKMVYIFTNIFKRKKNTVQKKIIKIARKGRKN